MADKNDSTNTWLGNLKKYQLPNSTESNKVRRIDVNSKAPIAPKPVKVVQKPTTLNEQKKDCPFCHAEDDSFYIFPTRYSIAKKSDGSYPSLPDQLNSYVKDYPITYSKYTLKFLNIGYLYVLVEYENNIHSWLAYRVNDEGFLAKIKNINSPDSAPTPYGCTNQKHFANSSMICLAPKNKSKAKNAYMLYSKGFLTNARLETYRNNRVNYVNEKKWQKVDLNAWRSSQKSNLCFNQAVFEKNVTAPNFAKHGKNNKVRKENISEKFKMFPNAVCGVALYDALGITIELNQRRNDQYIDLTGFLNIYENGVSNHQRMNAVPLIESIEEGFKRKAISGAKNWNEYTKRLELETIEKQHEVWGNKGPYGLNNSNNFWSDQLKNQSQNRAIGIDNKNTQQGITLDQKKEAIEKKYDENLQQGTNRNLEIAAQEWENKYKPLIKYTQMVQFKENVASKTESGIKNATVVGQDHLIWLKSKQLINELHSFDPNHQKLGFIFYEYLMRAIEGTGGTDAGATLIDRWIVQKIILIDNIFMRAVLFNNQKAIADYNTGVKGFSAVTNYTDWTTSQNTFKQFVVTIAALDAAWDEWVSADQNKHYIDNFDKTFTGRAGRWSAEFVRVAMQKAKSGVTDRFIATQIACFIYARSGVCSKGINLNSLMAVAIPNFNPELKKSTPVSETLSKILNDQKAKGNARVASMIMVLEAINLGFQLTKPMSFDQKLQVWGGACGLITASLELVGVVTAMTKNAAHNLVKLAANSFAIFGSAFFTLYDFKGTIDQISKDRTLALIYGLRSASYLGLTLGYTKISIEFLQKIGTATGRPALIRLSGTLMRSGAYRTIAFLGGVVWLAKLNLIILGLTAIEIIYKALIADNKLEVWCKKSSFGIDAVKYLNEGKEIEAFNEAFSEVIGIK